MVHCLLGREKEKERVSSFNFKLKVVFDRLHLASTFIFRRKCSIRQEHFQTSVLHRSLCGTKEKRDIVYGEEFYLVFLRNPLKS